MQEFRGKTAVVTGAASGIGRGLVERFAAEGMRVVLADVEEKPLREAEESLLERGVEAIGVQTDVRHLESIEELHRRAIEAFGKVHILCNNAGIGAGGLTWETSHNDWEWTLGVNLWGVIHGVRTFVPSMIEHGEDGHIVNTASMAGMVAGPYMASYNVTKFGVVALSETMYYDLKIAGAKIGVSVLCPGFVATNIADSARNRPADLPAREEEPGPAVDRDTMRQMIAMGMPPAQVAEIVFEAIKEQRLWVFTDHEMKQRAIEARTSAILEGRNPELPGVV